MVLPSPPPRPPAPRSRLLLHQKIYSPHGSRGTLLHTGLEEPSRFFTAPGGADPRMGVLGPSRTASLPASCAAWPCLVWSTPLPLPLSTSAHTLGRPSSPGWLELLLQCCWGPRTRPQHTHTISWKRPPARGLGPCRVRGTFVEVTTDALPSPPHPRRAWAFHPRMNEGVNE